MSEQERKTEAERECEEAKAARAEYMREWRRNNKERVRAINQRAWAKRYKKQQQEKAEGK